MKKILIFSVILGLMLVSLGVVSAETVTIVSDTSVLASGPLNHYAGISSEDWGTPKNAVLTWKHPSWPTITDANWISTAYYVEAHSSAQSWRLFTDEIVLPDCAINIEGKVVGATADNAEEAYLNGKLIGSNNTWATITNYPLTNLHVGTNTLQFIVHNFVGSNTPTANPTGLIYKAVITYDLDCDGDGVLDVEDKCLDTESDSPTDGLGTNRWKWNGESWEVGSIPGKGKGPKDSYTIEDTYGCSCEQILERLEEATGEEFEGHHKFGCSKSILEDWIAGEYYVGPTLVETVEVPANLATPTESLNILESGKDYFLKAYGTADAGDTIDFDAKCSITNRIEGDTWTDSVSGYISYGLNLLNLKVDNEFFDWGGECNEEHTYEIPYSGTGNVLSLNIYDIYYPNNVGSLFVDIIEDKWVSLW